MRRAVNRINWNEAGLTLVEVLIASLVFSVGILGLVSAITSATIVDSVAQEHNLALEAAREVIERVKSEGAAALFDRINASEAATYSTSGENGEPDQQADAGTNDSAQADTQLGSVVGAASEGASPPEPSSSAGDHGPSGVVELKRSVWQDQEEEQGTSAGKQADGDAASDGTDPAAVTKALSWFGAPLDLGCGRIEVDSDGNFAVRGLEVCADDLDGKVGRVVVTEYAHDVVEITVTVRWYGSRGVGCQVLRCRITDWQDAR